VRSSRAACSHYRFFFFFFLLPVAMIIIAQDAQDAEKKKKRIRYVLFSIALPSISCCCQLPKQGATVTQFDDPRIDRPFSLSVAAAAAVVELTD